MRHHAFMVAEGNEPASATFSATGDLRTELQNGLRTGGAIIDEIAGGRPNAPRAFPKIIAELMARWDVNRKASMLIGISESGRETLAGLGIETFTSAQGNLQELLELLWHVHRLKCRPAKVELYCLYFRALNLRAPRGSNVYGN
ncbi:MAG: hypothetical protein P4L87_07920 [Formivibrio sp.]|nr:hypothetical protein [Formivibrio sp.]